MAKIDNSELKQLDPEDMLARIHEVPWQCQQAWQMAKDFTLPKEYSDINKVLVIGMGGSAIGGDLVSSLVAPEAKLPIIVYRGYDLPAFVDDKTLVIASSYSGNTEETLSTFNQALETGAKKLVITTGGKLKSMADEKGIAVLTFTYRSQPRAALAFSFLPVLCFLQKLRVVGDKSAEVDEALEILQKLSVRIDENQPASKNPARQLAEKLHGHLPVIYGAGLLSEVAHRWKTQINENSKAWAFHEVFPELNHNAVVGYQFPPELAEKILVVLLRSSLLARPIQLRYEVTCQLLERAGVGYEFVDGEGRAPLSQMLSLVLFGDYVSYYLAILHRIDPSPVEAINYLKEQISRLS
ncbi:MAG: bifunctional phosphoglucose/phosphomannose isomerase [Dehalococcoidales bacterium]|nr:MAG: bifunctional phosphoglucose/phosphomannose isomerase [Dehalococcoidales bacterium]